MNIGRWTTTKAALAVAGLLVIGGAMGSALALNPIVDTPFKFQGNVEFRVKTNGSALKKVYVVPAGKRFMLTDLIVSNYTNISQFFSVYTGAGGVCGGASLTTRIDDMFAPAQDNLVLAFQTGIDFGPGQAVCFAPSDAFGFHARGFLFSS